MAVSLVSGTPTGNTTVAGTLSSFAARATPCPWLPAEAVSTPRARPAGGMASSLASAPRILNAPVRCWFSSFKYTSRPARLPISAECSTGVRWIYGATRERATCTRSNVNASSIAPRWYPWPSAMFAARIAALAPTAQPSVPLESLNIVAIEPNRPGGTDHHAAALALGRLRHALDAAARRDGGGELVAADLPVPEALGQQPRQVLRAAVRLARKGYDRHTSPLRVLDTTAASIARPARNSSVSWNAGSSAAMGASIVVCTCAPSRADSRTASTAPVTPTPTLVPRLRVIFRMPPATPRRVAGALPITALLFGGVNRP